MTRSLSRSMRRRPTAAGASGRGTALRVLLAALVAALLVAAAPARAETPYRPVSVTGGGAVAGTVRLGAARSSRDELPVTKDLKVCGSAKASPRLLTGASGGVGCAVVYLEGVTEGKPMPPPSRATLRQRRCEYTPHVLLATLGSELEIVNDDPILHNVHAYTVDPEPRSIFNIAQPVRGQCTVVRSSQLTKPGFLSATCDAGHPWMAATIAIAPHPYYALTDTSGTFHLADVPPGTYTLVVWHEGVRLLRKETDGTAVRKYVYEEPYVVRREVVVPPNGTVRADIDLTLR